jgi:hypothetical protein
MEEKKNQNVDILQTMTLAANEETETQKKEGKTFAKRS